MQTSSAVFPTKAIASIKRSGVLDLYRGLAVLLMMVFHFCWDLGSFGFIEFSIRDPFWVYFRSLILTLFFTAIGWSAYVALTKQEINKSLSLKSTLSAFIKRDLKLLLSASAISLATYLAVPDQWIYFGILHFIFIASLISRPFVRWPVSSALFGITIVGIYHLTDWLAFPNLFYHLIDIFHLPHKTLDIVFPFPWIGVVFIGPLLGYWKWHTYALPKHWLMNSLAFMGRHALVIYLLHQIVLFAFVAALKTLVSVFL